MNNSKKIKLLMLGLIIAIILIVIMGCIIYKLYNDKDVVGKNTNGETSYVEDKDINSKINNINNESTDKIEYIELNEANYDKYSEDSRVEKITKNNDGTYTIIARVFEEIKLPTLSQKEVELLENGKEIQFLDHNFKIDDSEDANDAGYEYVIVSIDGNEQMKFYANINDNKTATLSYYTDMKIGKATNIYMKTVVDASVLGSNVSEYSLEEDESSEYTILTYSEDIQFENGKISSFKWTGI